MIQFHFHFLRVGHEVRGEVASVKLHSFYSLHFGFCTFCFFNSDDTVFAYFVHGIGNHFTDFLVIVCRNSCYLSNFFRGRDWLGVGLQFSNHSRYCLVDASFQVHWVCTCSYVFDPYVENRLSQNGCCSSSITRLISSFGSYFFYKLGSHVFDRLL